jgi:hypothetical protein
MGSRTVDAPDDQIHKEIETTLAEVRKTSGTSFDQ